jgi:hypothetical protein
LCEKHGAGGEQSGEKILAFFDRLWYAKYGIRILPYDSAVYYNTGKNCRCQWIFDIWQIFL